MIDMERLERVWLVGIAVAAAVLTAASVLVYAARFAAKPFAGRAEEWGQFGDYIGGTVGTILTAATIALLVISVLVQLHTYRTTKEELKTTSEALAGQLAQSRDRAARDNFHATLTLFLSQRESLRQRHTYSLQSSLSAFRGEIDRGSYLEWSSARRALSDEFHMRASFMSPIVKLLKRLTVIAVDEVGDASLLETAGACLDDDELRSIRFLAHFDVPDCHLSRIVTSSDAFTLVNTADEDKLKGQLRRYGRPREEGA